MAPKWQLLRQPVPKADIDDLRTKEDNDGPGNEVEVQQIIVLS